VGVVSGPVEAFVGLDDVSIEVGVSVDDGCKSGDFGDQVQGIFEGGFPVLALVDSIGVGSGELALRLQVEQGHRQLGHWVHVFGQGLHEVNFCFG